MSYAAIHGGRPTAPVFERDSYASPEQEAVGGPRAFFSSLTTLNRLGGRSDVRRISAQDWQPRDPANRIPFQAVAPAVRLLAIDYRHSNKTKAPSLRLSSKNTCVRSLRGANRKRPTLSRLP